MNFSLINQLHSILLSCFTLSQETKEQIKKNVSKLSEEEFSLLIERLKELRRKEIQKIENLDIATKQKITQNIQKRQIAFISEQSLIYHEKEIEEAIKIFDELD